MAKGSNAALAPKNISMAGGGGSQKDGNRQSYPSKGKGGASAPAKTAGEKSSPGNFAKGGGKGKTSAYPSKNTTALPKVADSVAASPIKQAAAGGYGKGGGPNKRS